jgi:hypothetical protein
VNGTSPWGFVYLIYANEVLAKPLVVFCKEWQKEKEKFKKPRSKQ